MSRAQAVLRQFLEDAERLLREIEVAFAHFSSAVASADGHVSALPTESLVELYRPVHSLKGIAQMVEAARPLAQALHEFENHLPPLIRSSGYSPTFDVNVTPRLEALLAWSKEFIALLQSNELLSRISGTLRGDVGLSFPCDGQRVWISHEDIHGYRDLSDPVPFSSTDWEWGQKRNAILAIGIQVEPTRCLWVWLSEVPVWVSFNEEKKRFPELHAFRDTLAQRLQRIG